MTHDSNTKCNTCKYSDLAIYPRDLTHEKWICKFGPPTVIWMETEAGMGTRTVFPGVFGDDWCYRWEIDQ